MKSNVHRHNPFWCPRQFAQLFPSKFSWKGSLELQYCPLFLVPTEFHLDQHPLRATALPMIMTNVVCNMYHAWDVSEVLLHDFCRAPPKLDGSCVFAVDLFLLLLNIYMIYLSASFLPILLVQDISEIVSLYLFCIFGDGRDSASLLHTLWRKISKKHKYDNEKTHRHVAWRIQ